MGDLENINTLSQLLLTFKSICYGRFLHPENIPFSVTVLLIIKALWFWINDRSNRNQSRTGGNFNQYQRDELNDIYRNIQERAEAKHENDCILSKW